MPRITAVPIVLSLGLMAGAALAANTQGASSSGGLSCTEWEDTDHAGPATFFAASGVHPQYNTWLLHGGLDAKGDVRSDTYVVESDSRGDDISVTELAAAKPPWVFGAVAIVRTTDGGYTLYVIGGSTDGRVTSDVVALDEGASTWRDVETLGRFSARVFAAGAWDPVRDAIVVSGGTDGCTTSDEPPYVICEGSSLGTQILSFKGGGTPT